MTQEQAKLTLGEIKEILSDWQDSEQDGWKVGNVVVTKAYYERILRALLASQTAIDGLLEIAEMAMPESYFETDSRVIAAKAAQLAEK